MLRMIILWLVVLPLVHWVVARYYRSLRREALEKEWDTDPANEGRLPDERAAFIEGGMEAWRHSFRRRMILLVYIVPLVVAAVTVYLVNYN